jgi:hypothetical protein
MKGPQLNGSRKPINLPAFPSAMAIPTDADVTAVTYAALLDDGLLTNDSATGAFVAHFFTDWRDVGTAPLRLTPAWLPADSGAFLTWLAYREPGAQQGPNDVDIIVNANVLYALARFGQTGVPGFAESVALINAVVDQGIHATAYPSITNYYPDSYILHYCVSRAFHEGPVPALQPAVDRLADDVESQAVVFGGLAHWNKGDPQLNTAFAVLTLLNAGRTTPLIGEGVAYLMAAQNASGGNWIEGVFFLARGDSGVEVYWESPALTTAMALEAICRYRLEQK